MPSHHHPPPHPAYAPAPPPGGPGYPPNSAPSYHPQHHHHSSSRHANGPPPGMAPPPPGMPMGGPPPEAVGPPPVSNGHPRGPLLAVNGSQPGMSPAVREAKDKMDNVLSNLAIANENTWMLIGAVAEQMQDQDRALAAFENALRHNPNSILGLNAVASIARSRDNFDKAIEYFQRILNIKQDNGEVWGSMGHCLLMKDDLPKAYTAYQQALYHLPNPKEPKLWYGIGILYDRYGSFEHAEEAFSSVLRMDPNFEKANEIYFRLGIIYKHQRKFAASLDCFRYILNNPPRPLTSWDIWFQLGHVYEQDRDYEAARDAYMRVLAHQPDHAKVLQQLGWLYHQPGAPFADQDKAVQYLTKSLETDGSDAQSWYLLGRAFMAGQRYNKAYEAYQQAVYRDGRNPTFWCSIGVLYYQINQYRDALDAYSRAIRLNSFISEVWYNLGSLYESCNNQITDAIDAYNRAADLDPTNQTIKQRLSMLQNAGNSNAPLPPAPGPVDVHPSQYSAAPVGGYPGASPNGSPRPGQDARPDGPQGGRDLPPPPPGGELQHRGHSPGPFRGGVAPPPLQHVDESRGSMSRHAPLAPIEVDRPPEARERERDYAPPQQAAQYHGRYDPAHDRRHNDSPSSPRRRTAEAYQAYPPYPPQGGDRYRDREREEWERRRAAADPRGPSPRMPDRAPGPPSNEVRQQPSPRYPEPYPAAPGYGHDSRGPPPPQRQENGTPGMRYPSGGRDRDRDELMRAPSPAMSTSSRASTKRKKESVGGPEMGKRIRDDVKVGGTNLKVKLRTGGMEGESPRREGASSPAGSAGSATPRKLEEERAKAPMRTVDEDYDESAADALMSLHGDRPTPAPSLPAATSNGGTPAATPTSASPVNSSSAAAVGNKRADPPSPLSPQQSAKKARGTSNPATSPGAPLSKAKTQVIEVLNAGRITPLPASQGGTPTPAPQAKLGGESEAGERKDAEAEVQEKVKEQDEIETTPETGNDEPAVTGPEASETKDTAAAGTDGDVQMGEGDKSPVVAEGKEAPKVEEAEAKAVEAEPKEAVEVAAGEGEGVEA